MDICVQWTQEQKYQFQYTHKNIKHVKYNHFLKIHVTVTHTLLVGMQKGFIHPEKQINNVLQN